MGWARHRRVRRRIRRVVRQGPGEGVCRRVDLLRGRSWGVPVSIAVFEPRFYEQRAQRHLAALAGGPVWINVAWGLTGNRSTRPAVAAIVPRPRLAVAAECK